MTTKLPSEIYAKVSDNVTLYRYENGWMVEFNGDTSEDTWVTKKIVASDIKEVLTLLEDYSKITLS